jgi:DNA primase
VELSDLIESVDILEYISQFIDLEQRGDEWWGLSCFREEKTPSFSVRTDPPVFFDYSSGIGGNVFTFIRYYNNCSAKEAVEILKKYAGVEGETAAPREKLAATLACKKFRKPKQTVKQSKGTILPDNYMERYEERLDKLQAWLDEGISMESLKRFFVKYDAFSDRLVYPIRNLAGKIVNIGGRALDPEWKEKGLRKYTYFYGWGTMDTIYGIFDNLDEILKKREVILFEGCKSVLLADTWGIKNTGAILTSHLNPHQMKILARLGCRVVFALDKEVRIREDHNIQKLKNYVEVEYLWDREDLLDDKDAPVDKGAEVFKKLYEGRLRYR